MKAISIRQPWAWLILRGGKDIENRDWATRLRERVFIHASGTMTREDYFAAKIFCSALPDGTFPEDFFFPTFESLQPLLGGIVGEVEIADCVKASKSPWFVGPCGFVLREPVALPFTVCRGMPGFFVPQESEVPA